MLEIIIIFYYTQSMCKLLLSISFNRDSHYLPRVQRHTIRQ